MILGPGYEYDTKAFEDGLAEWVQRFQDEGEAGLARFGLKMQNLARELCPVDTGRLRSSIRSVPGRDAQGPYVDVGTNVEYAPDVEYGTQHQQAQPYLRPALVEVVSGGIAPYVRGEQ